MAETESATERVTERLGLEESDVQEHWQRNVRLIIVLFVVWFLVSFLAAILLAGPLTDVRFGRIPVGFWFAQQGSIMVFVLTLIEAQSRIGFQY